MQNKEVGLQSNKMIKSKKGQLWMVWFLISAIVIITAIALIEPFKDAILDPNLGVSGLNCATPTDGYKSTCFVLKGSMFVFIGYVLYRAVTFAIGHSIMGKGK